MKNAPLRKRDRERLFRFYTVINAIPLAQDGSGSATVDIFGIANYCADMREIKQGINDFLLALCSEGIEELENDYYSPDLYLDALEDWVAERRKVDWERPIAYYSASYEKVVEAWEAKEQ